MSSSTPRASAIPHYSPVANTSAFASKSFDRLYGAQHADQLFPMPPSPKKNLDNMGVQKDLSLPHLPSSSKIATFSKSLVHREAMVVKQVGPEARDAIEVSPDLVVIISSRGIVLYVSPLSLHRILGHSASNIVGRMIDEVCHSGDSIVLLRALKGTEEGKQIKKMCRLKTLDGEFKWSDISGHKYQMQNKKLTKCYILSIRPCDSGSLDLQFLSHSVDRDALIIKVSQSGVVVAQFLTSDQHFLTFPVGFKLYSAMNLDDQTALSRILDQPVVANAPCVLLTVDIRLEEFHDTLYFTVLRFSESHSYISISKSAGVSLPNLGDIFETIYTNKACAIQYELEQIGRENKILMNNIDNRATISTPSK